MDSPTEETGFVNEQGLAVTDISPLFIEDFSVTSTPLNPAQAGGAYVIAKLDFSDDISGFNWAEIGFKSESGQSIHIEFDDDQFISGNNLSGSLSASTKLNEFTEDG